MPHYWTWTDVWLQTLLHHCNEASMWLFFKCFHGNYSDGLSSLLSRLQECKRCTRFAVRSHNFTVQIVSFNRTIYVYNFYSCNSRSRFHVSLSTWMKKGANDISIVIFCLLQSWPFIALFVSRSVAPWILSPCLLWKVSK